MTSNADRDFARKLPDARLDRLLKWAIENSANVCVVNDPDAVSSLDPEEGGWTKITFKFKSNDEDRYYSACFFNCLGWSVGDAELVANLAIKSLDATIDRLGTWIGDILGDTNPKLDGPTPLEKAHLLLAKSLDMIYGIQHGIPVKVDEYMARVRIELGIDEPSSPG